ncbi:MAG: GDYXXLXY domain-containing protein [Hyphomonadaceae bacterium]
MKLLSQPFRIVASAILCTLSLVGLVLYEGQARASGTEVVLRMQGVDPRSLLSGHYVVLSLQEPLADGARCPPGTADRLDQRRAPQWIALSPDGAHHSVSGAGATREQAQAFSALIMRGHAYCAEGRAAEGEAPGTPGVITLQTGIDRFHNAQAQAERIERLVGAQRPGGEERVFAIVSVGEDGRARLKGLLIDGERVMLDWS